MVLFVQGLRGCSADTCRNKIGILLIRFTLKLHLVGFSLPVQHYVSINKQTNKQTNKNDSRIEF
jgi:hypothetical protein